MQLVLDAFSENESQNTFAIPIFSTLHTKICITIFDVFDDGVTSSKTTKVPLFQLRNEQRKQCEREPSWVRNDMGVACSISNIMQNMINSI